MQNIRGDKNIVGGGGCVVVNGSNITTISNGMPGGIVGSGKVLMERRTAERVNKISADGPASVLFTRGAAQFLRVTADDNILPLIETKILGNELHIGCNGNFTTNNEILVEVEMPSLEHLTSHGSGNVQIDDICQPSLLVELRGSGNIKISGKADYFGATLNGSVNIKAYRLKVETAALNLNGSGNIRAYVSGAARAKLHGSGDIEIAGNPKQRDTTITGSGSIEFDD